MKYFNNITTADELKKQFRAYCVTMHPDKGGDAEEFKEMVDEYNRINANFDQAKAQQAEEEEARRQEEEWRKEEEERKRKEEEEARKAAEKMRLVIAKWSDLLEQVPNKGGKYGKPSTAYNAAVKRNIKAIFNKYFPGVQVFVTLTNDTWREKAVINWVDGPTVAEVESIEELGLFIATVHVCDPYEDYGHDEELTYNKEWRKTFGEVSAWRWEYERKISDFGKAEIFAKIAEVFQQYQGAGNKYFCAYFSEDDTRTLEHYFKISYRETEYLKSRNEKEGTSIDSIYQVFRKYYTISEATSRAAREAAEAPKFTPKHNAAYKAIIKALGANFFAFKYKDERGGYEYKIITPLEAAESLGRGELSAVLVKPFEYEGETCYGLLVAGGYKLQLKRIEKFAKVGFILKTVRNYETPNINAVTAETLTALRQDAEDVEAQRKAWEEAQKTGKASRKSNRTANTAKTDNTDKAETTDHATATDAAEDTAAPAEGLELVEIPGGVAVVGDSRTTFRNRKHIKAHGALWNKEAQQWQATDPDKVAQLREWFGVEDAADTTTTETDTTAQSVAQADNEPQADANTDNRTTEQPAAQADPIAAESVATLADALESICKALTDAAAAAQAEAVKTAERARKHTEAEQLRQDIANISAQVAQMSGTLNKMLARLAALEADTDNATATDPHTETNTDQTADTDTNAQPSTAPGDGGKADNTDDSRKADGTPNSVKAGKDGGDFVTLDLLRSACEDADQYTQDGDHIGAVLARLYALCACAVDVRDLIEQAQTLNRLRQARGVSSPEEYEQAQQIAAEGRKRAEKVLVPCAFATLYGEGAPGKQAAA